MSLTGDIALLRQVHLLAGLSDQQLQLLAFSGERVQIDEGETLATAGEPAEGGHVVLAGRLALAAGKGYPGLDHSLGPGGLINAPALITGAAYPFTATAEEPSELLLIRRPVFLRLLGEFPTVAARLHAELAQRLALFAGEAARLGERLDADDPEGH